MKVSYNWIKKFVPNVGPVDELVQKIGAQLGAVEEVVDLRGKYDGIVVAEIKEAKDHPDADKLNVYQINDGKSKDLIQVVSGDRKLQVGDKVAWLAPGTTVPSTWGTEQAFKLEARPLRGEMSHGMFASGKELDINDDNTRVLVLDTDLSAGTPLGDAYELDDVIIDIENKMFTHRPDCFGVMGVAREVAGIYGVHAIDEEWYFNDQVQEFTLEADELPVKAQNHIKQLVPTYQVAALSNVQIKQSPILLQSYLRRHGIRPINNVVDLTNYLMLLTGQPMHAFDYDKIKLLDGASDVRINVRHPLPNESITLLDGRTIKLSENDILIASNSTPIALGGVMGGANVEVSETTKNIIIECATFDMYQIRRTSMKYGIFTDAVTRFSKGQSAEQCGVILAEFVRQMLKQGAKLASKLRVEPPLSGEMVAITTDFIESRLGLSVGDGDGQCNVERLLRTVDFRVEKNGNELLITPPFWRTDIEIAEDLVEEVGRLYGYDKLPHNMPQRSTTPVDVEAIESVKTNVRNVLVASGANELQTYSFVPQKLITVAGQDASKAFTIRNAISPELQKYRITLLPSLLDKVQSNVKMGYDKFALFELGRAHLKNDVADDNLLTEHNHLAFVVTNIKPGAGAAFYEAKKYLDHLMSVLNIQFKVEPVKDSYSGILGQKIAPFSYRCGAILVNKKTIGFVGEFKSSLTKTLKLPKYTAGFEISLDAIVSQVGASSYKQLIKYPGTEQDLCFRVKSDVMYAQVVSEVLDALPKDDRLNVDVYPVDIYQKAGESEFKQVTIRLKLRHQTQTLKTETVNGWLDVVSSQLNKSLSATRV